jgi:AraC family transcriptional regulator, regulatory protein of adaptative response / methylated-DNA-[protein]-cysteine methyltransferase
VFEEALDFPRVPIQPAPVVGNLSESELWDAVRTRDARYSSSFVYAVKSTGIFCRPTCPSRRPRRDLVSYYASAGLAKEAGFRACSRCHPDEVATGSKNKIVEDVCRFINENPSEKLSLEKLSQKAGLSPFYLQRLFKKVTGVSPRQYVEAVRLGRLKLSLKGGESVRSSTYRAGYNTSGWLYSKPDPKLGITPSSYKSGGAGLLIHYLITDCPLGHLLVASTENGICSVNLGDSQEKLVSYLRYEYPKAHFNTEPDQKDSVLALWVNRILEYLFTGKEMDLASFPLDIRATAFQWRVWKELQSISHGSVKSYSEVAKDAGYPKASRAVANACASNPVPLVVPCHRVVRKDGSLGGYRLGVDRKRKLLEKEGVNLQLFDEKV